MRAPRQLRHTRDKGCGLFLCSVTTLLAAIALFTFPLLLLGRSRSSHKSHEELPGSQTVATVLRVKLLLNNGTPAVEIVTTAPVNPRISKLDEPMRLVIDLPNANMSVPRKLIPLESQDVSAIRLELSATDPPLVHMEVDLRKPMEYTWEAAGNRLLVRLRAIDGKLSPVSATIDAVGSNVVPVDRLASGASVTASSDTTVLRLRRGGDFYVCPRTAVSVTRSRNGPDLMLAISGGALETHVTLENSADEVITPDFRILLRGPGEFHYAIRTDPQGNTCVRTLPGNTSSAIIYELMGDGKFEVQPQDQLVFHGGRLSPEDTALHSASANGGYTILPVECGCAPPARPVLLASTRAEGELSDPSSQKSSSLPPSGPASAPSETQPSAETIAGAKLPAPGVEIPELNAWLRDQPHVEVEATLVYQPSPSLGTALPLSARRTPSPMMVLPPPVPTREVRHKRMFDSVRHFFGKIFR
jgi:AMIN domain